MAIIRPPRYDMIASNVGQLLPHPEGRWVAYASYEKLADRWQAQREYIAQVHKKVAALQAENERLRKAGDGLMFEGETMAHEVSWNPAPWDMVVAAWVAAKEGGRK
jgi:hypothetical protein